MTIQLLYNQKTGIGAVILSNWFKLIEIISYHGVTSTILFHWDGSMWRGLYL